jgi:signal transduction histidine kinase/DNA-binding response OmpR family regulator
VVGGGSNGRIRTAPSDVSADATIGLRADDAALFGQGGEAGALMRAIDWSATPLGPVSGWSQALRTIVGLLLRNRFPLLLWWGPEFVQLYNDAYAPIPGEKHPRALGQPAAQCWSEIWDIIGPMIEAPYRGEPATWSDDLPLLIRRKGILEETHFKVAYSPVPDESTPSGIGGVLATVAETTQEVYARRQLGTLRDLAEHVSDAKTAEQACAMAARTMDANPKDLPCALFYLLDADGKTLRLAGSTAHGNVGLGNAAPSVIGPDDVAAPWPIAAVVEERRAAVVEVEAQPSKLVILPLASAELEQAYGAVLFVASPHRELNELYRSFFDLAAEHVTSAIRNAEAYRRERERAEKLAELDRAKTAFFSNVSHEFRTPLTLMLAPLDEMRTDRHGEHSEQLALAHRNALRLLKLVNTLLDFSRIEAGRVEASYEPTDLAALTADLASSFRSAVEHARLRFVVDCAPLPDMIYVDHDMWEKIVLNLLSNAFKFTFEGSITVRLRATEGGAELEVADTGIGIEAQDLPRIFDRFHRVEGARSRSHEGSGIGLALVQELVRLHGGTIDVRSVLGKGSAFVVRVAGGTTHLDKDRIRAPRVLPSTAVGTQAFLEEAQRWGSEASPEPALPAAPLPSDRVRRRILLADDNADMRDYVGRLLREHWDVDTVADGQIALDAIRSNPPDLVLTDVMMPGLDGFALLRALRSDVATREIPVVMLSARAGEESTAEALGAGADDYLVKPFTARDLFVRITARLSAVEAAHAAREQRTNLYRAFMQAPFPVGIFRGPTHVVEAANDALLRVWGKSPAVLGLPLRDALPEDAHRAFLALVDEVHCTGVAYRGREALARLPSGPGGALEDVFFDSVYTPLLNTRGAVEGLMVCAFDVTQMVRAKRDLETANRAKDEFLATMSHELRTPLNAVLGWAALLLEDPRDAEKLKLGLSAIDRNARAQARLVSDLLDVSRIVSGKLHLAMKKTALSSVMRAATEAVRPAADAKGVHLALDLDPDLGSSVGDPDRLQQIAWNLLSNAVRFTPRGGTVTVSAAREQTAIVMRVRDTGAGIPREHLAHIFERFRQVDGSSTRTHGGLGLGLAIVRHLAEGHGGMVEASSDGPGSGATFTVRLPIRAIDTSSEAETTTSFETADRALTARPLPAPERPLRNLRILVIEDEKDSRELIRVVLEERGARVVGVSSARSALEEGGAFDLIISDIGMPGMDGYSLMRQLRAVERTAKVPAIALTAYARQEDADRALAAGYQRHVSKPVDSKYLVATIQSLVI